MRSIKNAAEGSLASKVIAYFTDAHLGQKLAFDGGIAGNKMRYDDEPEEHKENLLLVLDDIARRGIEDVVFGGDIGTRASNAWFFATLKNYGLSPNIVLGNHDHIGEVRRHYDCGTSDELTYAHEDAQAKYIFMDSSSNAVSARQLQWVAGELEAEKQILLFVHHPILAIDTPVDKTGAALQERDKVKAVLQTAKTHITMVCGHYHMNDETSDGNIRQFTTPAVAYQISKDAVDINIDEDHIGYRLIKIDGANITTEVVMFERPLMRRNRGAA
jgi:3',5'-cyclic-AMP phosphodiesterase